jgi:glycosyltransferase involved in cell wall biosynthesis
MPVAVSVFGVEPFRIGGTETFARELSLQLGKLGWQSVLCFLSKPPEQVKEFLTLPNVSLEVLEDSIDFSLGAAVKLARILRRYRPEVLHLHFTGFLGVYPWVGRLRSVRKVFFTDHTSRPAGYVAGRAPHWKRSLVRVMNHPLTKVISVSDYGYRCLTALDLLPAERHEMVYNGVDLSRVSADPNGAAEFRRRYAIPNDRALVVQVSWMIPEKGIPELLQAARVVLSRTTNVHFVLVGEGEFRPQFMNDAAAMGLDSHVTWTGMVQDPFGEGVYAAADIVCQLSHWEEVFGWMIAEGMAYKKPIVATRVGGIPELVSEGKTGFLVDRGDIDAIAERIILLLERPELRERMGQAGQDVARAKFDLRRNVAELIQLYAPGKA